jgi:hypothetical protein
VTELLCRCRLNGPRDRARRKVWPAAGMESVIRLAVGRYGDDPPHIRVSSACPGARIPLAGPKPSEVSQSPDEAAGTVCLGWDTYAYNLATRLQAVVRRSWAIAGGVMSEGIIRPRACRAKWLTSIPQTWMLNG